MKRMKNFYTTARYYGGNLAKIKTRFVSGKRPVKNWSFMDMGMMENFQGGVTCNKRKY
jgi:hypothetical protein